MGVDVCSPRLCEVALSGRRFAPTHQTHCVEFSGTAAKPVLQSCEKGPRLGARSFLTAYVFSDHLGSTGVTYTPTAAPAEQINRQYYLPFGGVRHTDGLGTDVGFTGQRLDGSTGLMFYNARYYDPLAARFVSADTIIPNPNMSQDWNRYSYVENNPVRYTDPTGHCRDDTVAECLARKSTPPEHLETPITPTDTTWDDLVAAAEEVSLVYGAVEGLALITAGACGVTIVTVVGAVPGAGCVVVAGSIALGSGVVSSAADVFLVVNSCAVNPSAGDCVLDAFFLGVGLLPGVSGRTAKPIVEGAYWAADQQVRAIVDFSKGVWNFISITISDARSTEAWSPSWEV